MINIFISLDIILLNALYLIKFNESLYLCSILMKTFELDELRNLNTRDTKKTFENWFLIVEEFKFKIKFRILLDKTLRINQISYD